MMELKQKKETMVKSNRSLLIRKFLFSVFAFLIIFNLSLNNARAVGETQDSVSVETQNLASLLWQGIKEAVETGFKPVSTAWDYLKESLGFNSINTETKEWQSIYTKNNNQERQSNKKPNNNWDNQLNAPANANPNTNNQHLTGNADVQTQDFASVPATSQNSVSQDVASLAPNSVTTLEIDNSLKDYQPLFNA